MSPQARVGADPDPSQDIYSLGVTMIQLLTGTPPVGDSPPPLPGHLRDTPLGRFISACVAGTPHRLATAVQARQMLAPVLEETPFVPVQVPDRTPPLPPQWGAAGPRPEFLAPGPAISGSGGATPSSASGQVGQLRQSNQAGRPPARRHSVSPGDAVLAIAIVASAVLVVVLILMLS
jgi:serine/threonine-protein kinase